MVGIQLASGWVPEGMQTLDGQPIVGVVVTAGGEWADGLTLVSEIASSELAGASYTRLAGTGSVERVGDQYQLHVLGMTAVDTSDSAARVGVWLATAGGQLIGYQSDPGAPDAAYLPAWPTGAYALPLAPVVAVTEVQAGTNVTVNNADPKRPVVNVTGEGPPDTTGSTAGQVWTSTGDGLPAEFAAPTGGGGIASIVAGANITVDATDPANPVVSAGASGGASWVTRVGTDGIETAALGSRVEWRAWSTPVTLDGGTGPGGSVRIGSIHADHYDPAGLLQLLVPWDGSGGVTGLAMVMVDGPNAFGGGAGSVYAKDMSGATSPEGTLHLHGAGWWLP